MKFFVTMGLVSLLLISCSSDKSDGETESAQDAATAAVSDAADLQNYPGAYAPMPPMDEEYLKMAEHLAAAEGKEIGWNVPKASEVDIPAYPGALMIAYGSMGEEGTAEYKKYVTLATKDSKDDVVAYYTDILVNGKGWNHNPEYGVFQPGTGMDYMNMTSAFVNYMEVGPDESDALFVKPGALDGYIMHIQITYDPR